MLKLPYNLTFVVLCYFNVVFKTLDEKRKHSVVCYKAGHYTQAYFYIPRFLLISETSLT
jgi:hypothetical protein